MVSVLSGFCCAQSFAHSCALWSVHVSSSVFISRRGKSCRVEGLSRRSREASAAGAAQRFVNVRARQLAQKVRGREREEKRESESDRVVHKGKTVAASAVRTVAFHLDSVLGFWVWVSVLVSVSSSVSVSYLCLAGRHRQAGRIVISLVSAFFIDVSFCLHFFLALFFALVFFFWVSRAGEPNA